MARIFDNIDQDLLGTLRAEFDGLGEDEFVPILDSFQLVTQPVKMAARDAYRDVARGSLK